MEPIAAQEVARRGRQLYEERIRPQVEPEHDGRFLVVDVDSGEYALADDELEAFACAREKTPEGILFLIRVGHRAPTASALAQATVSSSTDSDARTRRLRRTRGCRTTPDTRLRGYPRRGGGRDRHRLHRTT